MTNIDTTYIDNIRKQDNDVLADVQNIQAFSGQELINNQIMVLIAHVQKLEEKQSVINTSSGSRKKKDTKECAQI